MVLPPSLMVSFLFVFFSSFELTCQCYFSRIPTFRKELLNEETFKFTKWKQTEVSDVLLHPTQSYPYVFQAKISWYKFKIVCSEKEMMSIRQWDKFGSLIVLTSHPSITCQIFEVNQTKVQPQDTYLVIMMMMIDDVMTIRGLFHPPGMYLVPSLRKPSIPERYSTVTTTMSSLNISHDFFLLLSYHFCEDLNCDSLIMNSAPRSGAPPSVSKPARKTITALRGWST